MSDAEVELWPRSDDGAIVAVPGDGTSAAIASHRTVSITAAEHFVVITEAVAVRHLPQDLHYQVLSQETQSPSHRSGYCKWKLLDIAQM